MISTHPQKIWEVGHLIWYKNIYKQKANFNIKPWFWFWFWLWFKAPTPEKKKKNYIFHNYIMGLAWRYGTLHASQKQVKKLGRVAKCINYGCLIK